MISKPLLTGHLHGKIVLMPLKGYRMKTIIIDAEYSINKVGLIVYYPLINWIMALHVDPKYRKMGAGSALISKVIEDCKWNRTDQDKISQYSKRR